LIEACLIADCQPGRARTGGSWLRPATFGRKGADW
jgi:hypothetical protein